MNTAFEVLNSCWNEEVGLFLESHFVSSKTPLKFKTQFRFINCDIFTFDGKPVGINGASYTLEITFNAKDKETMLPLISALNDWTQFKQLKKRFIVQTYDPIMGSVSIFFANGAHQTPEDFKRRFTDYNPTVISEI